MTDQRRCQTCGAEALVVSTGYGHDRPITESEVITARVECPRGHWYLDTVWVPDPALSASDRGSAS